MNSEIAQRYFASFGWSLRLTGTTGSASVQLHENNGFLVGNFDGAKAAMTSWLMLVQIAYAHAHSVETAVRLAKEDADQRAAILEWARSGGEVALPRKLDTEINLSVARIEGDNATVLAIGKHLAPLIARENADLAADVFARLCEQDHQTLEGRTRDVLGDGALPLRL